MSRWTVIAALSLSVNAVGWGVFGRILAPGAPPRAEAPLEISLAPPGPAPPPRVVPEPPRAEPPRAVPTPAQECVAVAPALPRPRATTRPRPPDRPVMPTPPVPPREVPEPAREEPRPLPPAATAILPVTPQGTVTPAKAESDGAAALRAASPSVAVVPNTGPARPAFDRRALAGQIHAAIGRHRRYPRMARHQGIEGTVVLSFRVDRTGGLEQVKVLRSAGELLDEAALEALRKAAPLPYLPGAIRVPVVFSLDD